MIETNYGRLSAIDLLQIRQIEQAADLPEIDFESKKICTPTKKFLDSIGTLLQSLWGSAVDATQAYQVWLIYRTALTQGQAKFAAIGDIAHWFHLDATKMPGEMVLGLISNLPRVQAQETLNQGNFNPIDHEYVYQLVLLATGSEKQALDARSEAMRALIAKMAKD